MTPKKSQTSVIARVSGGSGEKMGLELRFRGSLMQFLRPMGLWDAPEITVRVLNDFGEK
jgi:hypothetical protein